MNHQQQIAPSRDGDARGTEMPTPVDRAGADGALECITDPAAIEAIFEADFDTEAGRLEVLP